MSFTTKNLFIQKALTQSRFPNGLVNRYSFNGDLIDSVGGKNGTGFNLTYSNGAVLNGTTSYIQLPAGLMNGLSSFTIEWWYTPQTSAGTWQRVFDFGTGTTNFMFFTYNANATNKQMYRAFNNGSTNYDTGFTGTVTYGLYTHLAITHDAPTNTTKFIGAAVGGSDVIFSTNTADILNPTVLSPTTLNYLGKSLFVADGYMKGTIREFRIWNKSLSLSELQSNNLKGPATL